MSLRDELAKWLAESDHRNWNCGELANRLAPRLEAKLREAQTETVERCADWLASSPAPTPKGLRSLSPDPGFMERERLRARLEEARLWKNHAGMIVDPNRRIADLERQLAEPAKEVRDGAPR